MLFCVAMHVYVCAPPIFSLMTINLIISKSPAHLSIDMTWSITFPKDPLPIIREHLYRVSRPRNLRHFTVGFPLPESIGHALMLPRRETQGRIFRRSKSFSSIKSLYKRIVELLSLADKHSSLGLHLNHLVDRYGTMSSQVSSIPERNREHREASDYSSMGFWGYKFYELHALTQLPFAL